MKKDIFIILFLFFIMGSGCKIKEYHIIPRIDRDRLSSERYARQEWTVFRGDTLMSINCYDTIVVDNKQLEKNVDLLNGMKINI